MARLENAGETPALRLGNCPTCFCAAAEDRRKDRLASASTPRPIILACQVIGQGRIRSSFEPRCSAFPSTVPAKIAAVALSGVHGSI